jgi:hypothetical protein
VLDGSAYRPFIAGATGTVELTEPAPVTIDLAALAP